MHGATIKIVYLVVWQPLKMKGIWNCFNKILKYTLLLLHGWIFCVKMIP